LSRKDTNILQSDLASFKLETPSFIRASTTAQQQQQQKNEYKLN
jgi:hypothetical protein